MPPSAVPFAAARGGVIAWWIVRRTVTDIGLSSAVISGQLACYNTSRSAPDSLKSKHTCSEQIDKVGQKTWVWQ